MPDEFLRRACDAIMRSREGMRGTPERASSYRRDSVTEPPAAATVELVFQRQYSGGPVLEIPRGTRVSTHEVEGARQTFMTGRAARMEPGQREMRVLAYHAEFVDAELLGFTTDLDRFWTLARPPVVAATTADLEFRIGVACETGELLETDRVVAFDGRVFLLWTEVGSAWTARAGSRLFVVDRGSGEIAPLPRRPRSESHAAGDEGSASSRVAREVRVWYWRGGGAAGNVAAGTLTALRDSLVGVVVTNPVGARGGRDAGPLAPLPDHRFGGPAFPARV